MHDDRRPLGARNMRASQAAVVRGGEIGNGSGMLLERGAARRPHRGSALLTRPAVRSSGEPYAAVAMNHRLSPASLCRNRCRCSRPAITPDWTDGLAECVIGITARCGDARVNCGGISIVLAPAAESTRGPAIGTSIQCSTAEKTQPEAMAAVAATDCFESIGTRRQLFERPGDARPAGWTRSRHPEDRRSRAVFIRRRRRHVRPCEARLRNA